MYRKSWIILKRGNRAGNASPWCCRARGRWGKTYTLLEFGRTHYENVAYFNFEMTPSLTERLRRTSAPMRCFPSSRTLPGRRCPGKDTGDF